MTLLTGKAIMFFLPYLLFSMLSTTIGQNLHYLLVYITIFSMLSIKQYLQFIMQVKHLFKHTSGQNLVYSVISIHSYSGLRQR